MDGRNVAASLAFWRSRLPTNSLSPEEAMREVLTLRTELRRIEIPERFVAQARRAAAVPDRNVDSTDVFPLARAAFDRAATEAEMYTAILEVSYLMDSVAGRAGAAAPDDPTGPPSRDAAQEPIWADHDQVLELLARVRSRLEEFQNYELVQGDLDGRVRHLMDLKGDMQRLELERVLDLQDVLTKKIEMITGELPLARGGNARPRVCLIVDACLPKKQKKTSWLDQSLVDAITGKDSERAVEEVRNLR